MRAPGDDRARDLARHGRCGDPLRREHRHRRHDLRHRPVPQAGQRRPGPGDRRRPTHLGLPRRSRQPFYTEAAGHYRHPDTVEDIWPESFHTDVPDRILEVGDRESILTARALARHEGILVGGSSGLATAGALQVARELGPDALVVALMPDSGRNYLSKYHSPAWLHHLGFLDDDRPDALAGAGVVGTVHTVTAHATAGEAAALLRGAARDQPALPVVLPGRDPRFATAVAEILTVLDPAEVHATVARDGVGAALPAGASPVAVGTGETVTEALARLDEAGVGHAVVIRDGRLAGLVTEADLVRLRDTSARSPVR